MRILIVSQYFWPEVFRINDLAQGLKARGHDVTVLTGFPNYPAGEFFDGYRSGWVRRQVWQDISIVRVPHLPRGRSSTIALLGNFASFALSASSLGVFLLRKCKFDVVLVHQPSPPSVAFPGLLSGRVCGAPTLLWVQDLWPDTLFAVGPVRRVPLAGVIQRAMSAIHRRFDVVLVQSKAFVDVLVGQGVTPADVQYLPNWAESLYQPVVVDVDATQRNEMPEGFCILFAGNIGESQSFETILSAAELTADLPDLHWVVLGDGRLATWVRDEVSRRALSNVHLLGRRPMEEMPIYFALADALLVSLRADPIYSLTIPSKVQSYLACGRPLIGSLNGEGARVIESAGAGMTAPAQDAEALAAAGRRMLALDDEARATLARAARHYYEQHFERESVIDDAEQYLIRAALTGKASIT